MHSHILVPPPFRSWFAFPIEHRAFSLRRTGNLRPPGSTSARCDRPISSRQGMWGRRGDSGVSIASSTAGGERDDNICTVLRVYTGDGRSEYAIDSSSDGCGIGFGASDKIVTGRYEWWKCCGHPSRRLQDSAVQRSRPPRQIRGTLPPRPSVLFEVACQ